MDVDKDYLLKVKSNLNDLVKCLDDKNRAGFYGINSNINSLMFDGASLKILFLIMLPNELSGHFANMMWSISHTGAYFGNIISGYSVEDIKNCVAKINKFLDDNIYKAIITDENDFYSNLIAACSLMQANITYRDKIGSNGCKEPVGEDFRNYYLRDLLDFKGFYVRGQEHQGKSLNGKGPGEVDILVCRTNLQPKIIVEGMNLTSIDSRKIDEHYEKLFCYDASLNENNYLLSYINVSDFSKFCERYKNHFINYTGKTGCDNMTEVDSKYGNIKVYLSKSNHNDREIKTFHILILFQ